MVTMVVGPALAGMRIGLVGSANATKSSAPLLRGLGARVREGELRARRVRASEDPFRTRVRSRHGEREVIEYLLEGTEILVPSPTVRPQSRLAQAAASRGIPILSEVELAYRIARAPIVAVTGTSGKTTTACLLAEILRAAGRRAWLAAGLTAGNEDLSLLEAAALAAESDAIVAEVDSFQLAWVDQFRPAVGVLTNITPRRSRWHASFDEYARCKARLFAGQRPGDIAVANALNACARAAISTTPARTMWFDRGPSQAARCTCVSAGALHIRWENIEEPVIPITDLPRRDAAFVENCLAAAAAAFVMGIKPAAIAEAIRNHAPLPQRMQLVAVVNGVRFVNDSACSTVDSAIRALESLDAPVVLICGGDGAGDFTPLISAAAHRARGIVSWGEAAQSLERAARQARFGPIRTARNIKECVAEALAIARPGDVALFSPGCSQSGGFLRAGRAFERALPCAITGAPA